MRRRLGEVPGEFLAGLFSRILERKTEEVPIFKRLGDMQIRRN